MSLDQRVKRNEPSLDEKSSYSLQENGLNVKKVPQTASVVLAAGQNHRTIFVGPTDTEGAVQISTILNALPTAGNLMHIVSTSTADTSGTGDGAREIKALYLNTDFELAEETIPTSGTTDYSSVATNVVRILGAEVTKIGDSSVYNNEGNLTLQHETKANHSIFIASGDGSDHEYSFGRSMGGFFTVPGGYDAYIDDLVISVDQRSSIAGGDSTDLDPIEFAIYTKKATQAGQKYPLLTYFSCQLPSDGITPIRTNTARRIGEKTDIILGVTPSSASYRPERITVSYTVVLVKRSYTSCPDDISLA